MSALADLGTWPVHPPTGPNSFVFAYIFTKKHPCWRLAPPNGSARPQWEILHPPLEWSLFCSNKVKFKKLTLQLSWIPLLCRSNLFGFAFYRDGVPFALDLTEDYSQKPAPPAYKSRLNCDLKAAVLRQRDFYYNVSLPHFTDSTFLKTAIYRYINFLELKKHNRLVYICVHMGLSRGLMSYKMFLISFR